MCSTVVHFSVLQDYRFAEADVSVDGAEIVLMTVTRAKRDKAVISKRNTKITSSVDGRISVTFKPEKSTGNVVLEVLYVNLHWQSCSIQSMDINSKILKIVMLACHVTRFIHSTAVSCLKCDTATRTRRNGC